jgi:hypothetical protein
MGFAVACNAKMVRNRAATARSDMDGSLGFNAIKRSI